MRISDWSSDVCSSDLHAGQLRLRVVAGEVVVASARADRTDLRPGVQRGLVDHAGVVVQAARDRQVDPVARLGHAHGLRSEEHTSELQSLMRISYAVFCLKKTTKNTNE